MVWTPLKNISQLGWLSPIYGKIKNVPNHQPVVGARTGAFKYLKHLKHQPHPPVTETSHHGPRQPRHHLPHPIQMPRRSDQAHQQGEINSTVMSRKKHASWSTLKWWSKQEHADESNQQMGIHGELDQQNVGFNHQHMESYRPDRFWYNLCILYI